MGSESAANFSVLAKFSAAVNSWFYDTFEEPTPLQEQAWSVIEGGEHVLVIAPTGSGKTLAAFLFAIDKLMREKACDTPVSGEKKTIKGARVLYVSPLKALGADIDRNLQEPLQNIAARLDAAGVKAPLVRSGMRTGDTTPEQRRALVRNPPDILITTPESLYLMLTSQARETLRSVETVIVDEVHALAGNKRGAHLAMSLERLDALLDQPAQRIGLSATVCPRDEIARYLGGAQAVRIVAAQATSPMDIQVKVPVRDMTAIPPQKGFVMRGEKRFESMSGTKRNAPEGAWKSDKALRAAMAQKVVGSPDSRVGTSSIWPYIEAAILDEVLAHRTTIVFVNSRGLCEKLTARINELYARRLDAPAEDALLETVFSPEERESSPVSMRSDMGSTSELARGAEQVIAKAHHGSVAKEKRLQVEHELKTGELPCVVATSSLELGIDMGSVDLVLQVAPPPSVASGLQRIGRANHQVGGRSEGRFYPRTRTEIIDSAVVSEGMQQGLIEGLALIQNPLDVLAQQTVAAVAMDEMTADAWYETVCRAASFSVLSRRAFDAVLDMLAGRHTSADLTEFSPRIVWDRESGLLTPRPSAQRLAVMSAGTIPDRGMFSVVLPEGGGNEGRRRVGELDEEMVYESRVGDIIALGTNSWRIQEITRDRVIVQPAPGRSARLPFWHGEGVGRLAETGRRRGEFLRAVTAGIGEDCEGEAPHRQVLSCVSSEIRTRLDEAGLDRAAQENLVHLIRAQREATRIVPHDKTLVVERCEDEQGDWRVILHSPYGRRVHEPWAMAVSERIARVCGYDAQASAADDGIVLRIPLTEGRLPGVELFAFDADELDRIVRDRVDSTALFAARFRECAARALLMTPLTPGKRAPLWQQRLKAGQLLEAARRERDFPLLLETARECLQDVYDLHALHELMEGITAGAIRLIEAQTSIPSPFAAPLLFGYVGEHLYQGDLPHAERRASLLSLDPALLGELLGSADMTQVLDEEVVWQVEENLQHLSSERAVEGIEGVADLLRVLGPLSQDELTARVQPSVEVAAVLKELHRAHRAFSAQVGGLVRWVSVDDALRLHEALGTKAPTWALATFKEAVANTARSPLDELVARFSRTHSLFGVDEVATCFGIGVAVARESLERLLAEGRVMKGYAGSDEASRKDTWASPEVFRRMRSLSLAKARKAVRAVSTDAYVRFLFDLQGVGGTKAPRFEGIQGVAQVIAQYEGVFLPALSWETHVFPSRVRNYRPALLDELISCGEVVWLGSRVEGGEASDVQKQGKNSRTLKESTLGGLVAFYPTDSPFAPTEPTLVAKPGEGLLPELAKREGAVFEASKRATPAAIETTLLDILGLGGGLFFRHMIEALRRYLAPATVDEETVALVLQELMWSGRVTNDTFAPVRAMNAQTASAKAPHPPRRRVNSRRSRSRYAEPLVSSRTEVLATRVVQGALTVAQSGRWSLVIASIEQDTVRCLALVESILDRYGVLTRDAVMLSGIAGGMAALFPVLRSMEDAGEVLRGSFVEGLGPAQFAARETVDVLRTYEREDGVATEGAALDEAVVLAADDPANLFGAGLPWPEIIDKEALPENTEKLEVPLLRPSRRSGSLVVLCAGKPVLYAAGNLRALLSFTAETDILVSAAQALIAHISRTLKQQGAQGARKKILVETYNGQPVLDTPFAPILESQGLVGLPDGMRLYLSPF